MSSLLKTILAIIGIIVNIATLIILSGKIWSMITNCFHYMHGGIKITYHSGEYKIMKRLRKEGNNNMKIIYDSFSKARDYKDYEVKEMHSRIDRIPPFF